MEPIRGQLLERRERLAAARAASPGLPDLDRLLREVDAALERMDRGTYGLCAACHEPIEPDRLLANPLVCVCLGHMSPPERRALEEDLDLAVRIQRTLLPAASLAAHGWDAAYHYEPAGAVSGDYCDLAATDRGLLFLAGDVSGKGVASSLLMSQLHAMFRSLLGLGLPLEQLVARVNRLFCESTLPSFYATLVCGQAAGNGRVELVNAGHCPPIWVRRRETVPIEASAIPIGMFCQGRFPARELILEPGDCLALYTDGLTEARNGDGAEYGIDRLRGLLASFHGAAPDAAALACAADWRAFRDGAPAADDLTILVLRRAPSAT